MTRKITYLIVRLIAAIIMLQTLYFKFSGSPESMYIFKTVGAEPTGRIVVGVLELVASILLFVPTLAWFGALLTIGLMAGAIFMHLTILGIEVMEDGGTLFYMALAVFICGLVTLYFNREKLRQEILPKLLSRAS
ncbi:MAG: DoxX family protein [Bacteroidota bacterium]